MKVEGVEVRPASMVDAYALWIWANDSETRAASFGRTAISWEDHVQWLKTKLADPSHLHLIAGLREGPPVGSIRFDTSDSWKTARLSYVLAVEARGQGLAGVVVQTAVEYITRMKAGVSLWAEVMDSNSRSLRVFRAGEWEECNADQGRRTFWLHREQRHETDSNQ